jgi:cytochrome c2
MNRLIVVALIAVVLSACSTPAPVNTQQIEEGRQLFTNGTDAAPACTLCHTLDGTTLVGPSLQGVATRAATRVQGQSAENYIRASILTPTAYKVAGFETGTMAPNYEISYTTEEVDAIVAFLLTQQ